MLTRASTSYGMRRLWLRGLRPSSRLLRCKLPGLSVRVLDSAVVKLSSNALLNEIYELFPLCISVYCLLLNSDIHLNRDRPCPGFLGNAACRIVAHHYRETLVNAMQVMAVA